MIRQILNLSRTIIHPGMTWLNLNTLLITLLFSFSAVNAQNRNGTRDSQYGIYTNFDPTIALVIVVLICAFFLLGVFSMFIRHCSELDAAANLSAAAAAARNFSPQIGLDPAVIEKFPVFVYSEVKDVKIGRETLECAICLSEFEDDETLRLLPNCNHVFHPECIEEWLVSHVTCPVCRGVLAVDPGESPKDSPLETAPDLNREDDPVPANYGESANEVAITVCDDRSRDSALSLRRPRLSISGRFPRSHSTGHSLIRGGENVERFTLRLPEELRRQIMANAKLKRSYSVNVISTKEWSVRKGYRIGGEGSSRGKQLGWSERWSMLVNPVFVSKGGGIKSSSKVGKEGDLDPVNGRNLLANVKLNCLNLKVDGLEEELIGVRSIV